MEIDNINKIILKDALTFVICLGLFGFGFGIFTNNTIGLGLGGIFGGIINLWRRGR